MFCVYDQYGKRCRGSLPIDERPPAPLVRVSACIVVIVFIAAIALSPLFRVALLIVGGSTLATFFAVPAPAFK